jgi:hypothetical protein
MMDFTVRHLTRHWRSSLVTLVCLTLASAVLAGLSGYTTAISAQALDQSLEEAGPAGRSLLITGTLDTFGDELYTDLRDRLGNLLRDRLVIRHAALPADPQPSGATTDRKRAVARLDVYSFDGLPEHVRLVEGRLPVQANLSEAVGYWPPPVEAVIGRQAAEQSGYEVGDRLSASGMYHRLDIVGIVEPLDPHDDLWGGDLSAFVVTPAEDLGANATALPLIMAPESMQSYLGKPVFPHEVSWRISLDRRRLGPDAADGLYSDLVSFQTQSATRGATTDTALLQVLAEFLARLSRLRMALWLLAAQSLILVSYALAMVASFVVERSQAEIAIRSARGMSVWQITRPFALEGLILALPAALLLGPGLGQGVVVLWSRGTGMGLPGRSSSEFWLLSAVAAGVGWLVLVLPVLMAAHRCSREPQPRRARPPQQSALHRRYVDLYLAAFGGLLVWQLNRSGSFLACAIAGSRLGSTPVADPLLLLGPFLLLIAAAMIFLRIVPGLLRLVARPFQHRRGLVLSLGLLRAARNPLRASRVVLLVSLAAGLVLFARILSDSLAHGGEALRSDTLLQGIAAAFQLNALMLVLFSVTTFLLVTWLAAQGREGPLGSASEFSVLRAMGLPPRRWLVLLVIEGIVVLGVGLLAGAAVGLGLSYTMIPYLSQALVEPLAGVAIGRIVVNWPAIARLYVVLSALHGSALALLWWLLSRGQVHPTSWMEEE